MSDSNGRNLGIRSYFEELVANVYSKQLGLPGSSDIERYVVDLLVNFLHQEAIFGLRDQEGRRIESLAEMLVEGDVRFKAPNFDREREVHRHIGDFLLFWSSMFPEALHRVRGFSSANVEEEAVRQGRFSYGIVSAFDHAPYALEARLFKRLSDEFEACQYGLKLVRASFEGFRRQGWSDGFQA